MNGNDLKIILASAAIAIVFGVGAVIITSDRLQQQSLSGGTSNITGNLAVSGNETVGGTSTLTGALAANGGFSVDSPAFTVADTTGATTIAGALAANGGLSVDTPAFTVANTSGDVATTGTLAVTGGSTLTGAVSAGGRVTVGTIFGLTPTTLNVTVTQDSTITAVGSFQKLTAAGAVSTGSITAGTAGDLLCLWNTGSQTITISDTGTLKLAGDLALSGDDVACLISNGTNWYQMAPVAAN